MINQGKAKVKIKKDGWTVVTADKKLSAQWEHTIAVTADSYEVLTLREEETL
jgi:methionyl aminopeptidase